MLMITLRKISHPEHLRRLRDRISFARRRDRGLPEYRGSKVIIKETASKSGNVTNLKNHKKVVRRM